MAMITRMNSERSKKFRFSDAAADRVLLCVLSRCKKFSNTTCEDFERDSSTPASNIDRRKPRSMTTETNALNEINAILVALNLQPLVSLGDRSRNQPEILELNEICALSEPSHTDIIFDVRWQDGSLGWYNMRFDANGVAQCHNHPMAALCRELTQGDEAQHLAA